MSDVNYADFAGDDDGPVAEAPAEGAKVETPKAGREAVREPDDFDDEGEREPVEGDEGEGDPEAEDDLIDDLDAEDGDEAKARDGEDVDLGDGVKLTREEIRELHAKREDYSRYSDELRIVQTEKETLGKLHQHAVASVDEVYAQGQALLALAQSMIPPEPDMGLLASDPQTYVILLKQRETAVAAYNKAMQEARTALEGGRKAIDERQSKATEERTRAEVDKLLKAVPQLKNPKKAEAYLKSITEYGSKYGFQPAEIREAVAGDHRMALILRKAALYDAKVAARPIPTKPNAQPSVPTATRTAVSPKTQDRRSFQAALERADAPNASRARSLQDIGRFFNDD